MFAAYDIGSGSRTAPMNGHPVEFLEVTTDFCGLLSALQLAHAAYISCPGSHPTLDWQWED